jgi:hypothetical protein
MKRILLALIVALGIGLGLGATPAQAATAPPPGWLEWLIPTGTLCVETGGSTIAAQAAVNWNRSDAVIVARTKCTGYTRAMTVRFIGVNEPDTVACAITGSESGWTRRTVRGASVLTPNAPAVYLNYAANLRTGCRATSTHVAHVINHELGHVLGLAHTAEASVLASVGTRYYWKYHAPTARDLYLVNRRY